jgi:glycosyltransferase involved in cell wall biosynthesis
MTKAEQFALAARALSARRIDDARKILESLRIDPRETQALALRDWLLHLSLQEATSTAPAASRMLPALGPASLRLPSGRPLPRISIVTPSFNQGHYIGETLQSVIDQGYPEVEHIVIDGGSTDDTMAVVERFRHSLTYVVSEKDRGQSHALNKGFAQASGEILCWLNSDDQLAPGALFAVALAFDSGEPDMVAGICEVYRDGKLESRHLTSCRDGPLPLEDLLDLDNGWNSGQFFYQPEVYFTRSLWERAGAMVREDCYYSMDYELWCRFALAGARLKVIGTPLALFRSHPAQKTAVEERFKSELRTVRQRFVLEHGLRPAQRTPRPINWALRPRLALLNDHGARYGAGIAHARIGAALETAECEVELFELNRFVRDGALDLAGLLSELEAFQPHAVVWGNVHSIGPEALQAVTAVSERYPAAWIAHDFWLVTGRCAYFGDCEKYLTGCDASCPTADEYPSLAPERIAAAHGAKRQLLEGPHRPMLWANSSWTQSVLQRACGGRSIPTPSRVRLGVPRGGFGRQRRAEARRELDIPSTDFVLLFSASSLSDERKGVGTLLEALRRIEAPRMRLLVLGNSDVEIDSLEHDILALGYVTDAALLATAFAAADVFVGPSQEETFGQVFIEAALSGTPSIAFDRSGMVDAVVHRTTGLRVPSDAAALARAIVQLANDRPLREQLGFWAPIWARSTHSLEASYRSMHHAFEDLGLLQRLSLPRRITLMGQSRLCPDPDAPARSWLAAGGVSPPEGPYPPEFPEIIQWCSGPVSRFRLRVPRPGRVRVQIDCMNPLFDHQELTIELDDVRVAARTLGHTAPPARAMVEFDATAKAGWCLMALRTSRFTVPGENDARSLALIVKDIRVMSLESAATPALAP